MQEILENKTNHKAMLTHKIKQKTAFLCGYGLSRGVLLLESFLSMKKFYFINPKV